MALGSTKNLEWLIENAIHGDVNGDNPGDLRRILEARREFRDLIAHYESAIEEYCDETQRLRSRIDHLESLLGTKKTWEA